MRYGPVELIVVDYLQLLNDKQGRSGSEVLRIAQITRSLKSMAGEIDCPVILISQLNRNVEHRGGEPELFDLRDSGAIEQDSDLVLLMWNDDDEDKKHLKVAKNRDGPTREIPVWFDGPSFTFTEPTGSHSE
jgi:replicative DNA helicase